VGTWPKWPQCPAQSSPPRLVSLLPPAHASPAVEQTACARAHAQAPPLSRRQRDAVLAEDKSTPLDLPGSPFAILSLFLALSHSPERRHVRPRLNLATTVPLRHRQAVQEHHRARLRRAARLVDAGDLPCAASPSSPSSDRRWRPPPPRLHRLSPEPALHLYRLAVSTAPSSLSSRSPVRAIAAAPNSPERAAAGHVAGVATATVGPRACAR
jgi:hypothetical protein